jgi:hypothetical protein
VSLYQIVTADQVIDMLLGLARARGVTPHIEGNTARITLTIPPESIGSFPEYAQVFARRWSGQVIRFTNHADQWKLDEIPMQAVDTNTGRTLSDSEAGIAGQMAYAAALDRLAAAVQSKRIKSVGQARLVFRAECDRLARGYPGFSDTMSPMPLEQASR